MKLHAVVGVATNIVLAADVTDETGADSPQFAALLSSAAGLAKLVEVSADKAYLSNENLEVVVQLGGKPFIPFKINSRENDAGRELWNRMYHYFCFKRDEFMAHYHRRSNVESTFSAIKRKFKPALLSRKHRAKVNETLAKVLCHNLVVLVHEIFEREIDPVVFIPALTRAPLELSAGAIATPEPEATA